MQATIRCRIAILSIILSIITTFFGTVHAITTKDLQEAIAEKKRELTGEWKFVPTPIDDPPAPFIKRSVAYLLSPQAHPKPEVYKYRRLTAHIVVFIFPDCDTFTRIDFNRKLTLSKPSVRMSWKRGDPPTEEIRMYAPSADEDRPTSLEFLDDHMSFTMSRRMQKNDILLIQLLGLDEVDPVFQFKLDRYTEGLDAARARICLPFLPWLIPEVDD